MYRVLKLIGSMLIILYIINSEGCVKNNRQHLNSKTLDSLWILMEADPTHTRIEIVKDSFKMKVFYDSILVKTFPVAIGLNKGDKERVGDKRTPEGIFYVEKIENASYWTHDFGDGKGPVKGAYGPWFIRLYTGADVTNSGKNWTGIGIHGTHDSLSIGHRASDGCIRMYNKDIIALKKVITKKTPVLIRK